MATRPKILLLDDEKDLLDSYANLLEGIPSNPEIATCTTASRALAMLGSDSFDLFVTDLRMPTMDGLQILSIVRRKYPQLRTIVLTGIGDEQFRARSYAMGADLYWEKPDTREGMQAFQDCVESLLQRTPLSGFRGVQNKSLVDIIQLECLSQNSSTLRVTRDGQTADIWMASGNVIDARVGALTGEAAFREIMTWKSGNFELLPPDPDHPRVILSSYQGLLLDTAQALDEGRHREFPLEYPTPEASPLAVLAAFSGVDFVLTVNSVREVESWGLENAQAVAEWIVEMDKSFREFGEQLQIGEPRQVQGAGARHRIFVSGREQALLCVGLSPEMDADTSALTIKQIVSKWQS